MWEMESEWGSRLAEWSWVLMLTHDVPVRRCATLSWRWARGVKSEEEWLLDMEGVLFGRFEVTESERSADRAEEELPDRVCEGRFRGRWRWCKAAINLTPAPTLGCTGTLQEICLWGSDLTLCCLNEKGTTFIFFVLGWVSAHLPLSTITSCFIVSPKKSGFCSLDTGEVKISSPPWRATAGTSALAEVFCSCSVCCAEALLLAGSQSFSATSPWFWSNSAVVAVKPTQPQSRSAADSLAFFSIVKKEVDCTSSCFSWAHFGSFSFISVALCDLAPASPKNNIF